MTNHKTIGIIPQKRQHDTQFHYFTTITDGDISIDVSTKGRIKLTDDGECIKFGWYDGYYESMVKIDDVWDDPYDADTESGPCDSIDFVDDTSDAMASAQHDKVIDWVKQHLIKGTLPRVTQ
jgi:hypothetical protein